MDSFIKKVKKLKREIITILIGAAVIVSFLDSCISSDSEIGKETETENIIDNANEEIISETPESTVAPISEQDEEGTSNDEQKDNTLLKSYFFTISEKTTMEEIINYCNSEGLAFCTEHYTWEGDEIKIANNKDDALIKYNRTGGENILFSFDAEGFLRWAIFDGNILYNIQGGNVFGWDGSSGKGEYYYR